MESLKIDRTKLFKPSTYAKNYQIDRSTVYLWLKNPKLLSEKGLKKVEIDGTVFIQVP